MINVIYAGEICYKNPQALMPKCTYLAIWILKKHFLKSFHFGIISVAQKGCQCNTEHPSTLPQRPPLTELRVPCACVRAKKLRPFTVSTETPDSCESEGTAVRSRCLSWRERVRLWTEKLPRGDGGEQYGPLAGGIQTTKVWLSPACRVAG